MADLHLRLLAREELEASFETLMAQGIQASLDYIQVNVAPKLATLQQSITLAQEQIDQIIIGGKAPDTLKFGGQLPAYYATAQGLQDVQTSLVNYLLKDQRNAPEGVAPLGLDSKVPLENLPTMTTTTTVGAAVAGANGLATPDDGDTFAGVRSGTSTMFRTTWGNIKAALTTLFDSRYLKFIGGIIDGTLAIRSGAPTLNLIDTDGNVARSLHHNAGLIGFLKPDGSWGLYTNDGGNVWTPAYGWLHERFAYAGSECQHNSGVVEFSGFDTGITDSIGQASNPYVVIGLRRGNVGQGNASYLRCVALRNR
ncbi:hypothetical protein CFBP5507_26135 (plasmid) [Agrobacterium salinitolerans]|uniref:Uncharacterized protein n=1 Tax=Agrobacterium salinitolerans TaxID=1183413 RepID=A0A4Z1QT74_9HYPH|nr:hypothetical protein [Agrobacterium salinitolerans]UYZ11191.1 hypothetical protein CFBP5507_26135 [Agrobacterium salinitolerans]